MRYQFLWSEFCCLFKLRRESFGPRNERKARLIDQMELQLEELEATATEDELAAEKAAASSGDTTQVHAFTRKRLARKPFPAETKISLKAWRASARSATTPVTK